MLGLLMKNFKNFCLGHKALFALIAAILFLSLFAVFLIRTILFATAEQDRLYTTSFRRFRVEYGTAQENGETAGAYIEGLDGRLADSCRQIGEIAGLADAHVVTASEPPLSFAYTYSPCYLYAGRYFTKEECREAAPVAIASNLKDSAILPGDTLTVNGGDYTVVGISIEDAHILIYEPGAASASPVACIDFVLEDIPDDAQTGQIRSILARYFPDGNLQPPDIFDDSVTRDSTLNLLFIALFVLSLINITFLYQYLLGIREKQVAVMRVCGASRGRCVRLFLMEILTLSLAVYLAAAVCAWLFMPDLLDFTTNGNLRYGLPLSGYLQVLGVYLLCILLIFIPFFVRSVRRIDMRRL